MRFDEIELESGTLRELTPADLDALQSLLERSGDFLLLTENRRANADEARELWDGLPPDTPRSAKQVIGLLSPGLTGVVDLVCDWPRPGTWHIALLLLDPAARGRGTGSQVVAAIDAWAARAGADRLRISVVARNTDAMGFWRALGFAPVPAHARSVDDPAHGSVVALERPT